MLPQIDLEYDRADEALPRDRETKGRMFLEDEMDTRTMLEMEIGLELPVPDAPPATSDKAVYRNDAGE